MLTDAEEINIWPHLKTGIQMNCEELIKRIETIADPELSASWDRSGLQVATERRDIKKLAVMLDPLPQYITEALEAGAEFLLAHHPLALKPELPCKINNYYKSLKLLLGTDTGLYSAHTSLDVNLKGPAGWLGYELGLLDCEPLETISDGKGFGEVGNLPEPMEREAFIRNILGVMELEQAVICGPELPLRLEKIAYCGGSGGSLVEEALKKGAQVYITGDIKYHTALDSGIPVIDVGHHALEEEMMKRFAHLLSIDLPGVKVIFIPSRTPFGIIRETENEQ